MDESGSSLRKKGVVEYEEFGIECDCKIAVVDGGVLGWLWIAETILIEAE